MLLPFLTTKSNVASTMLLVWTGLYTYSPFIYVASYLYVSIFILLYALHLYFCTIIIIIIIIIISHIYLPCILNSTLNVVVVE